MTVLPTAGIVFSREQCYSLQLMRLSSYRDAEPAFTLSFLPMAAGDFNYNR